MNLTRALRHLWFPRRAVDRAFPSSTLDAIETAIRDAERGHRGEIRFAIEGAIDWPDLLRGLTARTRAIQLFSDLHVWDTEHNNGVLIFVLLGDHDVEIVADRGIHRRVQQSEWEMICREMERLFAAGRFEEGALTGIRLTAALLARHFPPDGEKANELPDRPFVT